METKPLRQSSTNGSGAPRAYSTTTSFNGIGDGHFDERNTQNGTPSNTNETRTKSFVSNTPRADDVEKIKTSFFGFPRRSKYVLVLCCFAQMCSAVAFAVIAPFYPHEARKKGVSTLQVGMVFSVFELVNFTMSPLIGNFLTRIGTKFVFISGIFVAGMSSILFGILDKSPGGTTFFVMSLVCRAFIALGFSSFTVANFAIISSEFPSRVATMYGVLEAMQGIGLMAGPLFGSALYELGGFSAPFYSLGGLVLISDVLIYFLLPDTKDEILTSHLSMTSFARVPLVLLSMANIIITSIGISFLESTLASHLESKFDLSVTLIGTFFIIAPALYAISTPVCGFLVDQKGLAFPVIIVGLLCSIVGYLIIAPCPWPAIIPHEIWAVVLGLVVLGVSYAQIFPGATKCLVNAVLEEGYEEDLNSFALVSGLFYFSYCFGAFAGPFIGGFLTQTVGFEKSYTILALMHLPNIITSSLFCVVRYKKRKQINQDRQEITSNDCLTCDLLVHDGSVHR